jgi:DNA-binding NtrC family response regulator
VRILAATNRDLEATVQQGTFREDLYYRLNVVRVQVPPLRAHPEDIAFLAETFLQRHTTSDKRGPRRFTREALRQLEQYAWPGNVRQLSHVIERAVTLSEGEWIDVETLGLDVLSPPSPRTTPPDASAGVLFSELSPEKPFNLEAVTRHLLVTALAQTRGHKGQAAALVGVHPRTLTRMMRRYAIPEE